MSIATEEQTIVEKIPRKLYIGGEWRDASSGGTLEVVSPPGAGTTLRATLPI